MKGQLVVDASGCLQVDVGSKTVTPAWPLGYSVRRASNGFDVLDAQGAVVARSGKSADFGGGGVAPAPASYSNLACAKGSQVWAVGKVNQT